MQCVLFAVSLSSAISSHRIALPFLEATATNTRTNPQLQRRTTVHPSQATPPLLKSAQPPNGSSSPTSPRPFPRLTLGFPSSSSGSFQKWPPTSSPPPPLRPRPGATSPRPSRSASGRRRSAPGTRWCGASWTRSRGTPSSASATARCRPPTPTPRRAPSRPRPSTPRPPREAPPPPWRRGSRRCSSTPRR